ncbi:MAG: hypothetical protein ACRC4M_04270, partial [Mycoplasma sp.]
WIKERRIMLSNKEKVKLLLDNFLNKDGDISLKGLDLGDKNLDCSDIKANNIDNSCQESKNDINNSYQEAKGDIDNDYQEASNIYNSEQVANRINNEYQRKKKVKERYGKE